MSSSLATLTKVNQTCADMQVEKAARIKAKIIKENGGVEPTAGHPQYGRYHRLVWICQGVEDPMLWTRPFSKLEAL